MQTHDKQGPAQVEVWFAGRLLTRTRLECLEWMERNGPAAWSLESHAQAFTECKRHDWIGLCRDGDDAMLPSGRFRTIYQLTDEGREALKTYRDALRVVKGLD